MIDIALTPRERPEDAPPEAARQTPTRAQNIGPMLDLGNTVYFAFRGRAFGVPPLPWLEGEKILDAWMLAQTYGESVKREDLNAYFHCIRTLAHLIWMNTRPVSRFQRLLKAIGLHSPATRDIGRLERWLKHLLPNPFMKATEREVADYALFLSERRMSTSEPAPPRATRSVTLAI